MMGILKSSNGSEIDMDEVLATLRKHGVTRFVLHGGFDVTLGPLQPPRELEDFATPGPDAAAAIDDDARWDHVGIRLRREVTP